MKEMKKRKMLHFDCARKNQMAKVTVSGKSMPDTKEFSSAGRTLFAHRVIAE